MNIKQMNLSQIETILEGKISKNPNRFEAANGIIFEVYEMNDDTMDYFSCRGAEIHHIEGNVYYAETVMSSFEFSGLENVLSYHVVA